jgi:hypothetical protein
MWQWVNQTYNAGFNWANRNVSKPTDLWGLGASYAVATGTAVGMAYSLGSVVDRVQVMRLARCCHSATGACEGKGLLPYMPLCFVMTFVLMPSRHASRSLQGAPYRGT